MIAWHGTISSRCRRIGRSAGVAALLLSVAGCEGNQQLQGVMVEPAREISAFSFIAPTGDTISTAPIKNRPMLVFFGYTHCPDVCPTTLSDFKRAKKELGRDGDRVRFVFVTVDPERDTPLIADRYAKQFDSTFVGLSGDDATTRGIMSAFGATAARESGVDTVNYLVGHTAQAFLVDDTGRLIAMYPFGIGWDAMVADLKTLL